ncbi:MAG: Eco57I restriction-modification methylase domain-containing protein [Psychroflexus halocasei]
MSLFQNSILNKYLKGLESEKVNQAYDRFKSHFHNPTIQENIRNSKEEQYQGEFLIDLFVNVFDYTKNPTPNFNLTTELKNIKGSKKTDGAILKGEKTLAVIELKGTNTTDLSKVETQAFGYKNNHPGCNYVMTSNFEKLRFYIDNAVDFEEFNLFQLTKERFYILWLCLSSEYLLKDIPKKIKNESLTQEENITKELYKDYASFRNEVFDSIQKENPEYDKLTLFKKTQKLLDRFLFIFFAEDRLLLPPNSIRSIVTQWTDLRDKYDEYFPLYDRFRKYFGYMNTGHKGHKHDIFAYNGGLFAPDEILDNIKIDDELLHKHTVNLSNYDFESEVSVNILGHIFEHSLNDIDNIKGLQSPGQSKRKKDGVFYTPKYITKYIVDNTVGKLCEEKKTELDIQEADYEKERKGRKKATIKKLTQKIEDYRKWLLQISICDPACGSGAFLNQALEFLIAEHKYIDELQAKLFGDAMVLSEVENAILENNLFGVDINEESVEIAKLSLWLRTAQKGRKLTSLNKNIKCGNSLIDDTTVAGDKAFHWQTEFPSVFTEKNKKAYHITTAIHDSRTSARMEKYKVRERRDMGTNPYPNVIYFTPEDDFQITQSIAEIVKEDDLKLLAYNICADHIHLLLVCDIEEVPAIMQKIKGRTSYYHGPHSGHNGPCSGPHNGLKPIEKKEKKKPLWQQKYSAPKEVTSQEQLHNTLRYIQTNRNKHELPAHSKKVEKIIDQMCCSLDEAFAPTYTGGFDVVIGNPPYIKEYTNRQAFEGLHENPCYQGKMDLWYFFGALALDIIKRDYGLIGYIAPNNWITNSGASKFRNIVLHKGRITEFIDFGDFKVFDSAGIQTMIYIMKSSDDNENYNFKFSKILDSKIKHENTQLFLERVQDDKYEYFKANINKTENIGKPINFVNAELTLILDKIRAKQNFDFDKKEIAQGIVAPQDFLNKKNQAILGDEFEVGDGIFNISQKEYENLKLTTEEKKLVKPFFTTSELNNFCGTNKNSFWVIYTDSSFKNPETIEPYPNLKQHLDKFQEIITSSNKPYGLHRAREEKFFKGEKIISLRKCARPTFTFTDFDCYVSQTYFSIKTERLNQRYLTGLLNSNLIAFWLKYQGKMQGDLYQVDKGPLMNLPIIKPKKEIQENVSEFVKSIIDNKQKQIDYQNLLEQAKAKNNFDREIQLTKELEQLTAELEKAESEINSIIYELYQIEPTEITMIEESV